MSRELICPHCGGLVPIDPLDLPPHPEPHPDAGRTVETVIPQTISTDDLRFDRDASGAEAGPRAAGGSSANGPSYSHHDPRATAPESPPLSPDPDRDHPAAAGAFPPLRLDPPGPPEPGASPARSEAGPEESRPTTPWTVVLLGSYASAMTLACAWLWWSRPGPSAAAPDTIAADSRPDLQGAGDPASAAIRPLPPGHVVALGQTLRLGSLEITPLEIATGRVDLEHIDPDGVPEYRYGGEGVLRLRLRLKNTSGDATFAPFEPRTLRQPDRGPPESFLETDDGGRAENYPLPLASEWSIVGQRFDPLPPGEAGETVIVSAEDALPRIDSSATWRFRIRTGPDDTALIGVRFGRGQVR